MSVDSPSPRLVHLLSRLSDGLLDEEEALELDRLLVTDPGARDYYRSHVAVHLALGDRAEDSKTIRIAEIRRVPKWPAFAAAAALLLAGGSAWWTLRDSWQDPPRHVGGEVTDLPVLAVISATTDLRWNLSQPVANGERLGPGIVRIDQGTVSLSLVGGQSVYVRSPAEFELLNDGAFALRRGAAAFRSIDSKGPFVVQLPKGALVDMGSEFSADVSIDGTAEVRVFEKELTVSTVGSSGRTLEEQHVVAGGSVVVSARLSPGNRPPGAFLRIPPLPLMAPPSDYAAYASAVVAAPAGADSVAASADGKRNVADETGTHPLQLMGWAKLAGNEGQRYLVVNAKSATGFATPAASIAGLDTARGITVECLLYPTAENHGTAISLELADPGPPPADLHPSITHAPQIFLLERMARKGEQLGHIHPDFSFRTMFRSPAGYLGGTNLYSRESHLLHRWIHVAAVHDGAEIRLYVDGHLSDSTASSLTFHNASLRPIVGRLHPVDRPGSDPGNELRQWIGGIDEVAIYGRALTEAEIRAHAEALKP